MLLKNIIKFNIYKLFTCKRFWNSMETQNNNTLLYHSRTKGFERAVPRKDQEIPIHTLTNATLTTNL